MAKIYLVRHGESVANTEGIYQGQTYNTGLSSLGKKQVKKLASKFTQIKIDQIIASPLMRTMATAKAVGKTKYMNILVEPLLIETNHGNWEGKSKDTIVKIWPEIYKNWLNLPKTTKFPGGESFIQTQERVLKWWNLILQTKKDTLVVTHDNIIRIILAKILNQDLNNIWQFTLNPTGITEIIIENDMATVNYTNNTKHLEGLANNIAKHAL